METPGETAIRRERLNTIQDNANRKMNEARAPVRDKEWFSRNVFVPVEPIIIGTSEDIGTPRARANHFDSVLDYYKEQIMLKEVGAPIPDNRKQTRIT